MTRIVATLTSCALLLLAVGLIRVEGLSAAPPAPIALTGETMEPPVFGDVQIIGPEVIDLTADTTRTEPNIPAPTRPYASTVDDLDDAVSIERSHGPGAGLPGTPGSHDPVDSPDDGDDIHDSDV